jgi:cytochrome c5
MAMPRIGWILVCLILVACERQNPTVSPTDTPAAANGRENTITAPANPEAGRSIYKQACATCHEEGIAGAPKMGDKEAWKPSLAKGMDELVRNSINGFQGNRGVMPPKGGAKSLTDAEVAAAVAWMVQQVQQNQ